MDSRIPGGQGGQLSDARPADKREPRDATMQLGVFAHQLIKSVPVQRTTAADATQATASNVPVATPTATLPNVWASTEAGAPAVPAATPAAPPADGQPSGPGTTQAIPVLASVPTAPPVSSAQQGSDGPVFVDASGRRGKKVRWLGWVFGLACTGFAVALVGSLLGGSARAPGLTLPEGGKAGAVSASPDAPAPQAPKVPAKSSAAPSHGASKAPVHKASPPAHAPSGSPHHSPTGKTSPSASASHKPSARAASPSPGKTRI
ncbi:hypothetical protein [Streptomyces sp. NPDC056682]|uniref:hypothetical protein n=1 Tax=Streptomyces sp. NPDC056682 TaxID=3345909 RepID=UPI0036B3CF61